MQASELRPGQCDSYTCEAIKRMDEASRLSYETIEHETCRQAESSGRKTATVEDVEAALRRIVVTVTPLAVAGWDDEPHHIADAGKMVEPLQLREGVEFPPEQFKAGDLVVCDDDPDFEQGKVYEVAKVVHYDKSHNVVTEDKSDYIELRIKDKGPLTWLPDRFRLATPAEVAAYKIEHGYCLTDDDSAAFKQPDADGWIEHDGKGCPVDGNELVALKTMNKLTGQGIDSLSPRPARNVTWEDEKRYSHRITHYRLVNPAPQPTVLSACGVEVVTR